MRRSMIWYAVSAAWAFDSALSLLRHNALQAALTAFFALCFFALGLLFQKRDRRS